MWVAVIDREWAHRQRRKPFTLGTSGGTPRLLGDVGSFGVVAASRLVPPVIVRERNGASHPAVPTEFEAAGAGHVVAFFGCLEAAAEGTTPRAGLPAQCHRVLQGSIVLTVCTFAFLPTPPAIQAPLPLVTRDAWVRPALTIAAETVATGAAEVRGVILVVQEDVLLATSGPALGNARVFAGEPDEEFLVGAFVETLLQDVCVLRMPEVETAILGGADELIQPALAHGHVKVVLQALEAEPVLARQCAAAVDLVVREADRAFESWSCDLV